MAEEIDLESAIFGNSLARNSEARDLDLDLGSGHMAYGRAPLSTHQISLKSEKLFANGWMYGHTN